MIEEIEELASELQPVALTELHHLEDGAVDVRPARPTKDVAAAVAVCKHGRIRPRRSGSAE